MLLSILNATSNSFDFVLLYCSHTTRMHLNKIAISLLTGLPKDPSQIIAGMLGLVEHHMVALVFQVELIRDSMLIDELLKIDRPELYECANVEWSDIGYHRACRHDALYAWTHVRPDDCPRDQLLYGRVLRYEFKRGEYDYNGLKVHAAYNADDEIYNLIPGDVMGNRCDLDHHAVSANVPIEVYQNDAYWTRLLLEPELLICHIEPMQWRMLKVQLPLRMWKRIVELVPEWPTHRFSGHVRWQSCEVVQWLIDTFPNHTGHCASETINHVDKYALLLDNGLVPRTSNIDCAIIGFTRGKIDHTELISVASESEVMHKHEAILTPYIVPGDVYRGTRAFRRLVAKIYPPATYDSVLCPELISLPSGDHWGVITEAIRCDSSIALRRILATHTGSIAHVCTRAVTEKAIRCMRAIRDEIRKHPILLEMASRLIYI